MFESGASAHGRYFEYLLEIGIIDQDQFSEIAEKCSGQEEKQLLFEISNIFANFTASDWFDLSCRIYKSWQRISSHLEENSGLNQSYIQTVDSIMMSRLPQQSEAGRNFRPEPIKIDGKSKTIKTEPQRGDSQKYKVDTKGQGNFVTPKKPLEYNIHDMLRRFGHILLKISYQAEYQLLKDSFRLIKRAAFHEDSLAGEERVYSQRIDLIPKQKQSDRTFRERGQDHHTKLYNDHFQKQAQIEIKREIKKASELDACTFYPQTNPLNSDNENLINTLRVPVYERLLQTKPVPANVVLEKQEYRELKGATFHPDISKSQKSAKYRENIQASPEDRKQYAVERLYGDAQIKEKIMFLKQLNRKEQELEGCSFFPTVLSPKKKKQNDKELLSRSVDRLYDENIKRHRKLLKKEVESRENELEGCTFQPDRPAKNYRLKSENGLEDLNAHERLYERFKRKNGRNSMIQQDSNESFNKENSNKRGQTRHRSQSASQDNIRTKSPKFIEEANNINTPAFDRLYKDMEKRKYKLEQLKERVNKEEGATFKPKTNWSKPNYRSISSVGQSHQDIKMMSRYDSKYSEEGYFQDNAYQLYGGAENLNLRETQSPNASRRRMENEGRGYLAFQGNQKRKNV